MPIVAKHPIGAHVSAAGGLEQAVVRAVEMGGNCMQVFSGSPRVWARKPLASLNFEKYYSKREELSLGPVITHSLYLLNIASENPLLLQKSHDALVYDLGFDSLVKGSGIVVHLGSHQGRGWDSVREQVVREIAGVLEASPDDSTFLIENSAGQNGKLCSDFAEIRWLIDQLQTRRVGWCFDTCHGFAAGHALNEVANHMAEQSLTEWLKVIHVNDSRDPFASGRDRHANLGDGTIPREQLEAFLTDPALDGIPLILEVPGLDGNGPDAQNVARLKELAKV